jgi:hypothetical protein
MADYMRLPFYSEDERGQMTTMPYDPQNRGEYMQLSGGVSQMPAGTYTDPLEILRMQAQEQAAPTGIMGFLRNPAVRAALQGASQGFAQAARDGMPGAGYALSQGLAGAAQGVGSWEERQAKAAAERLKMMLDERRGANVTDYRYRLDLIAKRKMKEKGLPYEEALMEAQQEDATQSFEQRGALADKSYQNSLALEYIKDEIAKGRMTYEMGLRLSKEPDIAAAIEKAKAGAADVASTEKQIATYDDVLSNIDQMQKLAQKGVYTGGTLDSFGRTMSEKGIGAGFAYDQDKANNTVQIRQLTQQLKFGGKPPGMGAMSDSEWAEISRAIPNPDIVGDTDQLLAGLAEARRRITDWQKRNAARIGKPAGSAPAQDTRKRIRVDATGKIQ